MGAVLNTKPKRESRWCQRFTLSVFSYFVMLYLFTDVIFILLQKITVAECIETQSKAMTMLTIDQLSYLLKFALQKIKQPGVRAVNT